MYESFDKICRTCLVETLETKSLFNLHYVNTNTEQLRLSQILSACTSLQVQEDDNFPKQVCVQCESNILNMFSFQQQCLESDSVLRAIRSGTQVIQLKNIDEASLNFTEILSNGALEHDQVESFSSEVEQLNGSFIDHQLRENVIINKGVNGMHNDTASDNINSTYEESINVKYEVVNSHSMTFDYHPDKETENEAIHSFNGNTEDVKIEAKLDLSDDETTIPIFPCEAKDCTRCFTTLQDLKRHGRTHETGQNFCKICKQMFSSSSTLFRHMKSKHHPDKKLHLCTECGKRFSRSDDLKRHIMVHTGEKPFRCEKCGKAFAQSFRLLEHVRSHSNVKNFICAVCGKAFARYTSMLAHSKIHDETKVYECKKCGKRLASPGSLSVHLKIHSGLKKFSCSYCKKRFTSASNLIVHRRSHTGERPYHCQTCGKSFAENSRLIIHTRIHSGEKPFICNYCKRGCVSATQLKRHTRIHTGEKPYLCELCPQKFLRKEDLKYHIRIHREDRSFVCDVCNKGFYSKSILASHVKIHTGEKRFICEICDKRFLRNYCLIRHRKTHGNEEVAITAQHIEATRQSYGDIFDNPTD